MWTAPKINTWDDIRRQILKNIERDGFLTEGVRAGSIEPSPFFSEIPNAGIPIITVSTTNSLVNIISRGECGDSTVAFYIPQRHSSGAPLTASCALE